MKVSVLVLMLALFGASVVVSHDVIAFIVNDSQYYYDLSTSRVEKGSVNNLPAIRLEPFTYTNFSLTSPFVGIDVIKYTFAYTPETSWCSDFTDPPALEGYYEYSFGSNTCTGSTIACSDNRTMELTYNECNGFWGTTQPTYTIAVQ
mmetsp:Transcript_11207/g.31450  ORF Transcript_11207/g.31450 Transcript_11207/m.31450 type:complete len:147 (+) Transcript_11207:78-518(+)